MMLAFVVGSGRCGSTLVAELVARHPDVGFISNVDEHLPGLNLKGRWNNRLFALCPERDPSLPAYRHRRRVFEPGRLRVAPSEGWSLLERQVSGVFPRPYRDLASEDAMPWLQQRIREFFDSRVEAQGKQVFMHHLTGWPRAGLLSAAYPDARFVNVLRDGRAVANSWLQMGWWDGYLGPDRWYLGPLPAAYHQEWEHSGRSFVVLAGLGWKLLVNAAEEARLRIPEGQWLDVRLEDFMQDPRGQMQIILEFLGLDWTSRFEMGFARHRIAPSRGRAWRLDLSQEQVVQLERAIAAPLRRHGYQPTSLPPVHQPLAIQHLGQGARAPGTGLSYHEARTGDGHG